MRFLHALISLLFPCECEVYSLGEKNAALRS